MGNSRIILNLDGNRYGHLVCVERIPVPKGTNGKYKCKCDCGNFTIANTNNLKNGHTTSFGCQSSRYNSEIRVTHGYARKNNVKPIYQIWQAMKRRCYNENCKDYPDYGGRGIIVCDRWKNSFEYFLEDMGERPEGMTIDRTDNDGNYEPSNCRRATPIEQANNKRRDKRYNEIFNTPIQDVEY